MISPQLRAPEVTAKGPKGSGGIGRGRETRRERERERDRERERGVMEKQR